MHFTSKPGYLVLRHATEIYNICSTWEGSQLLILCVLLQSPWHLGPFGIPQPGAGACPHRQNHSTPAWQHSHHPDRNEKRSSSQCVSHRKTLLYWTLTPTPIPHLHVETCSQTHIHTHTCHNAHTYDMHTYSTYVLQTPQYQWREDLQTCWHFCHTQTHPPTSSQSQHGRTWQQPTNLSSHPTRQPESVINQTGYSNYTSRPYIHHYVFWGIWIVNPVCCDK